MTASSTTPQHRPRGSDPELRRVVTSAAIGQFVEWYDFVVYAYSAVVISTLFFPGDDPVASLLSTFAVYAVGFGMRPIGGVVFGHLGDKLGRRNVLSAVILLMGTATLLIGLLPTYAQIGIAAPIILVICRMLQGLSAGGEAMGSNSLVAEHSDPRKRGLMVGFCYSFANLPAVFAALLVLGITNTVSASAFEAWGWRIPFLLGGAISFIGLYIRSRVKESPEFEELRSSDTVETAPAISVLRDHTRPLLFTFVLAALSGLGFYSLTGYFVSYLTESVGLSSNQALISNSIGLLVAFVVMPLAGGWSDRIGRKQVLVTGAALTAVVSLPAYLLAGTGTLLPAILGQSLLAFALGVFFGPVGIAFLEHFPARVRFSGSAIGYNAAYIVFGGTAPFFCTWLVARTDSLLAPAVYTTIVAATVGIIINYLPMAEAEDAEDAEDAGDSARSTDRKAELA
ncbi:MAG: MFS transporter [Nocardioidaceae bacterium]